MSRATKRRMSAGAPDKRTLQASAPKTHAKSRQPNRVHHHSGDSQNLPRTYKGAPSRGPTMEYLEDGMPRPSIKEVSASNLKMSSPKRRWVMTKTKRTVP